MRKKIRLQKHCPEVRAQVLVVDTEGATTSHTEPMVATLKASVIENHYISPLKGTFFQTIGCNTLVGCEVDLVGRDHNFLMKRNKYKFLKNRVVLHTVNTVV